MINFTKYLNNTISGLIAKKLDSLDSKQGDGKIDASIWNKFASEFGGKQITEGDSIEIGDAIKTIMTASIVEKNKSQKAGGNKTANSIAADWMKKLTQHENEYKNLTPTVPKEFEGVDEKELEANMNLNIPGADHVDDSSAKVAGIEFSDTAPQAPELTKKQKAQLEELNKQKEAAKKLEEENNKMSLELPGTKIELSVGISQAELANAREMVRQNTQTPEAPKTVANIDPEIAKSIREQNNNYL